MVTALWCFVPESDRREVECVVVIMVVCGMVPWLVGVRPLVFCTIPPALTVELSKLNMNNGPTIFWLNHSTNIRQYSISTVTVKLCGQLAEVEYILPLVFCRRGVRQFAAFEPLADEVA